MGKVLAAFGSWLATKIGSLSVLAGWKSFIVVVLGALASVMIFNVFVDISEICLNWVVSSLGAVSTPEGVSQTFSFAGLAGYLAVHLRLAEAFALVLSIVLLKWALVKIPFVKW